MLIFRIVYVTLILSFLLLFTYFNSNNTSNVSLIVKSFENVSVVLTVGVSFLAGILFTTVLVVQNFLALKIKNYKNKKINKLNEIESQEKKLAKAKKKDKNKKEVEGGSSEKQALEFKK